MRTLFRLVMVVAIVLVVLWFVDRRGSLRQAGRDVRAEVSSAAEGAKEALSDIDTSEVVDELKRTGRVVRRKAARAAKDVAEASEDGRTTAAIKTKLAVDPNLSALAISVDTTDGRVTLAGHVDSPKDVARAMQIALEQDHVHEVISTLQVRDAPASPPKKMTVVP
jgi:osmotically-inducible protein OsmY